MNIRQLLARNVKYQRSIKKLSQEDLAGLCGSIKEGDALSGRSFISDIENCRRNITLDKIELLANALEIEPYELFITKYTSERV